MTVLPDAEAGLAALLDASTAIIIGASRLILAESCAAAPSTRQRDHP